jgi:hypothetical protein
MMQAGSVRAPDVRQRKNKKQITKMAHKMESDVVTRSLWVTKGKKESKGVRNRSLNTME